MSFKNKLGEEKNKFRWQKGFTLAEVLITLGV